MPFSFFTITLHFCTSDMVEVLFPQMWANCGIFVEQSQSFHRFSARWKNCCKRGNLSTKKPSLQTVEQVNGGGRWIALRFCLRKILTHIATRCRTRWCDSTAFHAFHGFCRDLPQPSENKKKGLLQNLMFRSSPPCNNYVVAKPRNGGIRWDLLFHQIHESGVEFQAVFNAA